MSQGKYDTNLVEENYKLKQESNKAYWCINVVPLYVLSIIQFVD